MKPPPPEEVPPRPMHASVRLGVGLALFSGTSVLLGLLYQWYVLTHVGPGRQTDALFAGMMLPQLMLRIVGGSLASVLIPLLSTEQDQSRNQVAWTLFQGTAAIWSLVVAVLIVLAPFWVPLTVPGFDASATELTVRLTRIQLMGVALTMLAGVQAAASQARHQFIAVELSSIGAGVIGFGVLAWGLPRFGIVAAAWANVIRALCQVVLQLPALGPYRRPHRHPALREAWRRMFPLVLGASYSKADGFVDRILASMAPPGALSLYHLALQCYASAQLVLNRAVVAPAVPVLSRLASARDWEAFTQLSRQRVRIMAWITLGLLPVLALVGRPVLTLLLAHGDISHNDINDLWLILLLLGGMWVTGATGQALTTSFYTRGDTQTPTRVGVIGFTIAIGLKLIAFHYFGLLGVAAASSVHYMMNAAVLTWLLRRALRRVTVPDGAALART